MQVYALRGAFSYCFYDCIKWPTVKVNDPNYTSNTFNMITFYFNLYICSGFRVDFLSWD